MAARYLTFGFMLQAEFEHRVTPRGFLGSGHAAEFPFSRLDALWTVPAFLHDFVHPLDVCHEFRLRPVAVPF
jgi:hypothetical protein